MKKFFSLVLALVMALSLTTVAWGAETTVSTISDFMTAVAVDDATVKLGADLGAIELMGVDAFGDNVTIVGNGHSIAGLTIVGDTNANLNTAYENYVHHGAAEPVVVMGADLTMENITFTGDVNVFGGSMDGLSVLGCTFKNGCSLTVDPTFFKDASGYSWDGWTWKLKFLNKNLTVDSCTFEKADSYAANTSRIKVASVANVTITNNKIDGAAFNGIQVTAPTSSSSSTPANYRYPHDNGTITITGNTISNTGSRSIRLSNQTNATSVSISSNVLSAANKAESNDEIFKTSGMGGTPAYSLLGNTYDGNPIAVAASGQGYPAAAAIGNTGYRTLAEAVAAAGANDVIVLLDASATIPDGYQSLKLTDGTYVVVPAVTMGDKFDLYLADAGMKDALAAGAEDVPALSFTNMPAKTNQDGSGNLAYIAASNGEYFVKTTNPTVADYAVTVAGKTDVLYYVTVVDLADVEYWATAKAFTNFGTKCGQLYRVDTTKEYYVIEKADPAWALQKDDVSYVVDPTTGVTYVNVLVGNEIKTLAATPVDDTNTVLTIDEILSHNWAVTGVKATTAGKTVPTQVTCLNCGAVVTKFYDAATKVPAGTVATAVPGYETATAAHDAWFFVAPAATSGGTVVTPSTDKVQSAATFDAGIAMYVGMSVLAATGSAVVIGKKKD